MPERNAAECPYHEGLEKGISEIKGDTRTILEKLESGAVQFAKQGLRIGILEKIVYGAVGLLLLAAVGVAIRSLVNGG